MTQSKRGKENYTSIIEQLQPLLAAIKPGCTLYHATANTTHFDTKGDDAFWGEALTELTKHQKNVKKLVFNYLLLTADHQTRLFWVTPTGATHIKINPLQPFIDKITTSANIQEPLVEPVILTTGECETLLGKYYQQNKFTTIQTYQENKKQGKYNASRAFQNDARKLHGEINKAIETRANAVFFSALEKLKTLNTQEGVLVLQFKVTQLIEQIQAIKKTQPNRITELTLILEATYQLVDPEQTTHQNSGNIKYYAKLADSTQGAPNESMSTLGTTMLIIGGFMLFYGAIIITLAVLSPPPIFLFYYLGVGFAAPGAILAPVGVGLFSAGQRSGMSKLMEGINHEVKSDLAPTP